MRCRVSFGVVLSIVGTTLAVHAVCRETFAQPAPTAVAAFPDLEPAGVTASVDPVAQLLDDDPYRGCYDPLFDDDPYAEALHRLRPHVHGEHVVTPTSTSPLFDDPYDTALLLAEDPYAQ